MTSFWSKPIQSRYKVRAKRPQWINPIASAYSTSPSADYQLMRAWRQPR
ncbi:hypothetical protein [Microcoleus sp. MON1_C1]